MKAVELPFAPTEEPEGALRIRWRDLVESRMPEAGRSRADWPVHLDHCFARILLDNTCGGPWRESVRAPAWANMPAGALESATELGEAVLEGRTCLAALNERSLRFRGKRAPPPAPDALQVGALTLRRWRRSDDAPFAALNADAEAMRHFPAPKTRFESLAEARALARRFEADGFGPWVVEAPGAPFLGFVGAMRLMRALPFPGGDRPGQAVEIGWRLVRSAWGRGFATLGARAALDDLFGRCGVGAVVAFTASANLRSQRVMERLGMEADGAFEHPALPAGHALRAHVLYRLDAGAFRAAHRSVA